MNDYILLGEQINRNGFAVIDNVYTDKEIMQLLSLLSVTDTSKPAFRKTKDLFAIRKFFREVPAAADIVFNDVLKQLVAGLSGEGFFVVKSIYFDKPVDSNWFVAWHQDLTISVNKKVDTAGYGPHQTQPICGTASAGYSAGQFYHPHSSRCNRPKQRCSSCYSRFTSEWHPQTRIY